MEFGTSSTIFDKQTAVRTRGTRSGPSRAFETSHFVHPTVGGVAKFSAAVQVNAAQYAAKTSVVAPGLGGEPLRPASSSILAPKRSLDL